MSPPAVPGALVSIAQTSMPEPAPGEALVKVEAFSVNRGEIFRLEDPRPGDLPGKDIAGLVVQAAADGTGPHVGQRVVGHPEAGGAAENGWRLPTRSLAPLPDSMPATHAAALPLAGLTALRLLRVAGNLAWAARPAHRGPPAGSATTLPNWRPARALRSPW